MSMILVLNLVPEQKMWNSQDFLGTNTQIIFPFTKNINKYLTFSECLLKFALLTTRLCQHNIKILLMLKCQPTWHCIMFKYINNSQGVNMEITKIKVTVGLIFYSHGYDESPSSLPLLCGQSISKRNLLLLCICIS